MQLILTVLVTLLIFGVLVFIHELGHFLAAKRAGIIVDEFAFGFGPKLVSYPWKGTLYRINLIPLGGYVKMLGDQDGSSFARYSQKDYPDSEKKQAIKILEDNDIKVNNNNYSALIEFARNAEKELSEEDHQKVLNFVAFEYIPNHPGNYDNKSISARIAVIVAGVIMNFLLGALLFYALFQFNNYTLDLTKLGEPSFIGAQTSEPPVLYQIYDQNLQEYEGSVILEVNGEVIQTKERFEEIVDQNYNQEVELLLFSQNGYKEVSLILDGDGVSTNFDKEVADKVLVFGIEEGSAAYNANLVDGAIIVEFAGKQLDTPDQLRDLLDKNRGKKVAISYYDLKGELLKAELNLPDPNKNKPILGAVPVSNSGYFSNAVRINYSESKAFSGFYHAANIMLYNVSGLSELVSESFEQKSIEPVSTGVGSIVAVFDVTFYLLQVNDFRNILNLTAMLSVTLAFMNILPIPLFDGGHLMFLILEKFRGRPLSAQKQEMIGKVFFILLIALTILIMVKDVLQFDWPSRIFGAITSVIG